MISDCPAASVDLAEEELHREAKGSAEEGLRDPIEVSHGAFPRGWKDAHLLHALAPIFTVDGVRILSNHDHPADPKVNSEGLQEDLEVSPLPREG